MDIRSRTPLRTGKNCIYNNMYSYDLSTPKESLTLSKELKKVLNERNLLTSKSRKKVCSMLDDLSPAECNQFDKRPSLRRQAIAEILTSEKSYISQLEVLMNHFVVPLKERAIISEQVHTSLFGQIEMIYNLNGELLRELEDDLDSVANAFLKLAPFFKLYSVYAFDYKNAILIVQDLVNKNPAFRKFIQDTETRPEVQRKLNSLMIVPIQRVPRYLLLLKQVVMYTSPANADYRLLQDSINQVESTVSHINSVIEDQEVTQMLLNLQNSLLNRTPNIVKPSRKIIKEGILNKVTRNGQQVKRYCILMSDIFMYCKVLKDRSKNTVVENSLECCCIFPLKKCKVSEIFPGNFKITCQGDGVILCTTDYHASQSWVASVKDAVELHIQCRKTLRKESSKRAPMRRKDVKHFDVDESPNKRKCDYESVFRCGVSSDSEQEESPTFLCFSRKHRGLKKPTLDRGALQNDKENVTPTENTEDTSKIFKTPLTPFNAPPNLISNQTSISTKNSGISSITPKTPHEHDPTYGFANKFSDTKSYYRTNSVDSYIQCTKEEPETSNGSENSLALDILYPLRENSGSSKSSTSSWLHKRQYGENENGTEILDQIATGSVPKKRVKFEDEVDNSSQGSCRTFDGAVLRSDYRTKPIAYEFSNAIPEHERTSLRSRVIDFFSRLF